MSHRTAIGVVERWDVRGQFGFIRTGGGADYFVHATNVVDPGAPLHPGEPVEFTPAASARGPRALRVRRLPGTCPKCDCPLTALECPRCGVRLGT